MLVCAVPRKPRFTVKEYRQVWAEKLHPKPPSTSFKRVGAKPKCRVKRVHWVLPGLHSVARFLRSASQNGFPYDVIDKLAVTKAVYIIGTTLHVHVLHIRKKDELNLILLATHLRLVDEVRIHNFQLHFYLTSRRVHVRITLSHWETVRFYLPYINRGSWVEREGKREREIRITFDDFLRPAIEAKRAWKPYAPLILGIPEYETDLISTYHPLPRVHWRLGPGDEGYSSESDYEVDVEHDGIDEVTKEGDEIMLIWSLPFFI